MKGDNQMAEKKITKWMTYIFKHYPDIDGEYVKNLRKKLNLSQGMFAELMRVSVKTVEKWEQGKNPVTNGNIVAMMLLDKNPDLLNEFIEVIDGLPEPRYRSVSKANEEHITKELKLAKAK